MNTTQDFAQNTEPCENSESFCEESVGYPTEEIDKVLSSHLEQEYFKNVLGEHTEKACVQTTETTITGKMYSRLYIFLCSFRGGKLKQYIIQVIPNHEA